jgi:dTDP-4-amino-4,6-dideoxygalactose transaminase
VFPVAVPDPAALVAALRNAGFDAATATSSIAAVGGSGAPRIAQELMSRIVFLPVYPELPAGELDRLVEAVERELASR